MAFNWEYRFTRKAEADLDSIVRYISGELSNPKAASVFVEKLQDIIDEARAFPESGSPVMNEFLENTQVRKKFAGNYVMYYLPDTNERVLYILRIIYGKRDRQDILNQLDLK